MDMDMEYEVKMRMDMRLEMGLKCQWKGVFWAGHFNSGQIWIQLFGGMVLGIDNSGKGQRQFGTQQLRE